MTLGHVSRAQLTRIGGTGVFVSALREALLAGEVDLAAHSLKDLQTGPAQADPAPRQAGLRMEAAPGCPVTNGVQLVWSEQAGQAPSVYCPCLMPG